MRPFRSLTWRRLALVLMLVAGLGGIGLGFYAWALGREVEARFAGRRWSLPSRVYSDATLLYPGLTINRAALRAKLHRLGYRPTAEPVQREGQMREEDRDLEIYLHPWDRPGMPPRTGLPVRLRFDGSRLQRIIRLEDRQALPLLTLEPEELALFFGPRREKRELVAIDQLPPYLVRAVLAAEDSRFYQHHGLDARGIGRALLKNLRHGAIRQGGSTITQQLAKNFFLTPERTLSRKLKEMLLALVIEAKYTKNEILEMYLNEIYLGQNGSVSINGVGEAARFYFAEAAADLDLPEAAALAGLIKSPNSYSPYRDPGRCRARRNEVLAAMGAHGWLTAAEVARAQAAPLQPAGYDMPQTRAPYFIDHLSQQLSELYAPEALASLGLSIFTTLDPLVQAAAEAALTRGLADLEQNLPELARPDPAASLQGAVVVLKPQTGAILAMVGGRDYRFSQYNRISQARRQAGSTFKVFTYLAGLDRFSPVAPLANVAKTYLVDGRPWEPRNYGEEGTPVVSLQEGLARSINRATVDLAMLVGLEAVVQTAREFDFSTDIQPYPSLALGAVEVYPLELARAYCALAASGVEPYPLALREVYDDQGRLLEQHHMQVREATTPAKAFLITAMLQSAVTHGTARGLLNRGVSIPVAGKTGTTNDFRDAWFIGYTPDILILVWVGFDNGDPLHLPGSQAALPIWADILRNIPHQLSGAGFTPPQGVVPAPVCQHDGFPELDGGCDTVADMWFMADNVPEDAPPLANARAPWYRWFKSLTEKPDAP